MEWVGLKSASFSGRGMVNNAEKDGTIIWILLSTRENGLWRFDVSYVTSLICFGIVSCHFETKTTGPHMIFSLYLLILQEDEVLFNLQKVIGNHWAKVSVT
jgi:hypothetical protein